MRAGSISLLNTFEKCTQGDDKALKDRDHTNVVNWTREEPSRRGLERLIIPEMGERRFKDRASSIQGVLRVQKILRRKESASQSAEYLRNVSLHLTKSARLFAAVMGQADSVAAQEDLQELRPERLAQEKPRHEDPYRYVEVRKPRILHKFRYRRGRACLPVVPVEG